MLSNEQFHFPDHPEHSDAPPEGYYDDQPRHEQMALPGMEMTPQQHAQALGRSLGGVGQLSDKYELSVTDLPGGAAVSPARFTWGGAGKGPTGQILMVTNGGVRGTASKMHATARRIAEENADIPMPKHSTHRTPDGVAWSRKEMKKYGEQVW